MAYYIHELRESKWRSIPAGPGYYLWYFPKSCIEEMGMIEYLENEKLNFQRLDNGMIGLYFGIAINLRERVRWHSAQPLTLSALSSGYLSTFRFSLLSMLNIKYSLENTQKINDFMDLLMITWTETLTKEDACAKEAEVLTSDVTYLMNLQGNKTPGAQEMINKIKIKRRSYKYDSLQ
jgi:hypothetical protein